MYKALDSRLVVPHLLRCRSLDSNAVVRKLVQCKRRHPVSPRRKGPRYLDRANRKLGMLVDKAACTNVLLIECMRRVVKLSY